MAANITAGQLRRMSQSCAITAFASQRRWLQSGSWTGRSGLATSAVAYRAGRSSRRHSGGSVLSWLAGFVAKSRESRRARNQSIDVGWVRLIRLAPPAPATQSGLHRLTAHAQVSSRAIMLLPRSSTSAASAQRGGGTWTHVHVGALLHLFDNASTNSAKMRGLILSGSGWRSCSSRRFARTTFFATCVLLCDGPHRHILDHHRDDSHRDDDH
jgi:hypothetical protein